MSNISTTFNDLTAGATNFQIIDNFSGMIANFGSPGDVKNLELSELARLSSNRSWGLFTGKARITMRIRNAESITLWARGTNDTLVSPTIGALGNSIATITFKDANGAILSGPTTLSNTAYEMFEVENAGGVVTVELENTGDSTSLALIGQFTARVNVQAATTTAVTALPGNNCMGTFADGEPDNRFKCLLTRDVTGAPIYTCTTQQFFLVKCPKLNQLCNSQSGGYVAATTVCNQALV